MLFFKNKRARHNVILFALNFIYVFILGLFDNYPDIKYIYNTVITLIFFASMLSIKDTAARFFYIPIVIMTLTWVSEFLDFGYLSHITGVITLIFFLYIIIYLLIRVATTKKVGLLEFVESINVYLLLGIAASILFSTVYADNLSAFNISGGAMSSRAEFIYFSFITMTTLGYGDISPVDPTARSLAIFFSVAGQLYLTMIIALLIGKYLSQATLEESKKLAKGFKEKRDKD